MANVIAFPRKSPTTPHRLLAALPDDNRQLTITVDGMLAASIRRAAAWAAQSPQEKAVAYLRTGFAGGDAA